MIRSFVALELDPKVKDVLRDEIKELKQLGLNARFSRIENLHLTLKFLGDIPKEAVASLVSVLKEVAAGASPMALKVDGRGVFPNLSRPRVVWSGVRSEDGGLGRFVYALHERLAELGYEKEKRPFRPHLTLARLRSPRRSGKLRAWLKEGEPPGIGWVVEEVVLFQSELMPEGARHTPLDRVRLGGD